MSVFLDKSTVPTEAMLIEALGNTKHLWDNIAQWVQDNYPPVTEEWTYAGKNYGWSFRLKQKKRTILYFIPQDGYFPNAFVFGDKAVEVILQGNFPEEVKQDLRAARKYAEGRGIRIAVQGEDEVKVVTGLVEVKMGV